MRITLFLILIISVLGCSKEVEIDQLSYTRKIVVDGYIEQDKSANIFLTLSSPYLTEYDSASIRNSFLNYAKITLSSSLGEEEILTLYRKDEFFPPFVYKSVDIKGQTGVSYTIKIEVHGSTVTSTTTIPSPPIIEDVRYFPQTDTTGFVEYKTTESVSDTLFLFAQVKSRKTDKSYHPPLNPMKTLNPDETQSNWIQLWRSQETIFYSANTQSYYYSLYPDYQYSKNDTIWLKIGAVDKISNEVLTSLFDDDVIQNNPFSFNGDKQITNIEGGIGRWTGIGTASEFMVCGALQ